MRTKTTAMLILLLLVVHPSTGQVAPTPLQRLSSLESSISTSWRNSDRATFQVDTNTALAVAIPKAILDIGKEVTSALEAISVLKILSPIFSILSIVVDVIGQTLFSEEKLFSDLYAYLQQNFITVNALIESNFHAIQDLQSVVLCGQAYSEVNSYKTQVNGFFARFKVMMQRAQTDRSGALAVFDTELPQYQSTKVLLAVQQLLMDKSLYTKIATYCARGDLVQYLQMTVELYQTFKQAIILDRAAKTRLANLTKQSLDTDRTYWIGQVNQAVSLMVGVGQDLVTTSWYNFYKNDADISLSSSALESASDAAGRLDAVLTPKYPYVRTAVMVIPSSAQSISVTDAFGTSMSTVNQDSFICYRSRRANGDTVIVFCRNQITYPSEQAELNTEYATDSRNILSLSLVDALRNDRWDDIAQVIMVKGFSFFAVTVKVSLRSGSVSYVQSSAAADLVFFQGEGTSFQALVIAKLVTGLPPQQTQVVVPPNKAVKLAVAVRPQWKFVAATTAVLLVCF